jgi:hypothetical protein
VEEMRHWKSLWRGMNRFLESGSLWWLLRAPLVRIWRIVGRRVRQPFWKKF